MKTSPFPILAFSPLAGHAADRKIGMFLSARRPLVIALLVAGAFFMENLDGTVIATAMPQMARSFGASPVDLNIGMTAYLLALAVFIPISVAAPILGPPVGGFITTYASWRWIFFLNVPLGLSGVVLAHWLIPNSRSNQKSPFDWIGFTLTSAACVSLMYGLDLIGRHESNWLTSGLLLVCSLAIGVSAVWQVRRHPHPLIDLSSLRVPTFAVTIWGGSLFRIAIGATPFLLPLMFQTGLGMNAFTSGLLVLAVFAGNLLMKPATTPALRRFGFRTVLIANSLLSAVTIFACALFSSSTPKAIIVAVLFAGGLFRSMQFTSLNTVGFADIQQSQLSG